jgi:hypothetical protein
MQDTGRSKSKSCISNYAWYMDKDKQSRGSTSGLNLVAVKQSDNCSLVLNNTRRNVLHKTVLSEEDVCVVRSLFGK